MAYPSRRTSNGIVATVVGNANNGTHTISYPSGSSAGDLLIIQVHGTRATTGSWNWTLSGGASWTLIETKEDTVVGVNYSWYWAFRGSETSVTITPSNNTFFNNTSACIVAYNGSTVDATSPIGPSFSLYDDNGGSATSNPVSTSSINTIVDDTELLLMTVQINAGSIAWSGTGVSELFDTSLSGTSSYVHSVAYAQKASPGATGSYSADPSGSARARGIFAVAVQYAPPPPLEPGDYTETFNASGSWVVPPGVTSVTAHCIGGGGGTSSGGGFVGAFYGGAAGGSYARRTFPVTEGQSISYVVGGGGSGGSSGSGGTAGGTSWFSSNDSSGCVAVGGAIGQTGGPNGGAGTTTGCYGDVVYRGGNGGTSGSGSGGGGGGAGTTGNGGDAGAPTAGTGTSLYGGNGGTGLSSGQGSNPGQSYGGGGSGARFNPFGSANGAGGGSGVVVINFTVPPNDIESSDSATVSESAAVALLDSDTATAVEGTAEATASWPTPLADPTASVVESASISIVATDAGILGIETAQIAVPDSDEAIPAEDAAILVESSDSFTGIDGDETILLADPDELTGIEGDTSIALADVDELTTDEDGEGIPATVIEDSDSLAIDETQIQTAPPIEEEDSGLFDIETEFLTITDDDTIELVDAGGTILDKPSSDSTGVVELEAVTISDSDNLIVAEDNLIVVSSAEDLSTADGLDELEADTPISTDAAIATETHTVAISGSDGLLAVDDGLVLIPVNDSDSGVIVEQAEVTVHSGEVLIYVDVAGASGPGLEILHPRKHLVERATRRHKPYSDHRVHLVERYTRRHKPYPDYREHTVERAKRVHFKAKES